MIVKKVIKGVIRLIIIIGVFYLILLLLGFIEVFDMFAPFN